MHDSYTIIIDIQIILLSVYMYTQLIKTEIFAGGGGALEDILKFWWGTCPLCPPGSSATVVDCI